MFVNLLELLHFVYLIKYRFIKRQGGLPAGRSPSRWAGGGRCGGWNQPAGHPTCPSVRLTDHATHDRSWFCSSPVCLSNTLQQSYSVF